MNRRLITVLSILFLALNCIFSQSFTEIREEVECSPSFLVHSTGYELQFERYIQIEDYYILKYTDSHLYQQLGTNKHVLFVKKIGKSDIEFMYAYPFPEINTLLKKQAKYTENIYKSNINKIAYNKKNIIRYNSKYSQIKFPISYYAPVDKEIIDLGYDIQLSIKVFQENKVNKTNDNFTLIGGLVDNEFINKVKYSEEEISQPEISSENIFNHGLREARFIFNNSIINGIKRCTSRSL